MEEIYIGLKSEKTYCSAIKIFNIKDDDRGDLYENTGEFWCDNCIFDTSVKINKDGKLGKFIQRLIEEGSDAMVIYELIDQEVLKNINLNIIYNHIENIKISYFEKGKKQAKNELKDWLGL